MSIPSHAYIELILNGHRFTTWADDDPPYMIDDPDSATYKLGQDGKQFGLGLPVFGGTFRIRLAPHSPSVQWCIEREAERMQRLRNRVRAQAFNGTLSDVANNNHWTFKGGSILRFPRMTIANQTYEASWQFEQIIPNVSSGSFAERFDEEGR